MPICNECKMRIHRENERLWTASLTCIPRWWFSLEIENEGSPDPLHRGKTQKKILRYDFCMCIAALHGTDPYRENNNWSSNQSWKRKEIEGWPYRGPPNSLAVKAHRTELARQQNNHRPGMIETNNKTTWAASHSLQRISSFNDNKQNRKKCANPLTDLRSEPVIVMCVWRGKMHAPGPSGNNDTTPQNDKKPTQAAIFIHTSQDCLFCVTCFGGPEA